MSDSTHYSCWPIRCGHTRWWGDLRALSRQINNTWIEKQSGATVIKKPAAVLSPRIKLFPQQPEKCLAERTLMELQPAQIPALQITSRLNRATKATLEPTQNQEAGGQKHIIIKHCSPFKSTFQ